MTETKIHPGVVGIFTDKEGRVVATATDFDVSHPGGFTTQEAQEWRVKDRLAMKVAKAYCSPVYAAVIDQYAREKFMDTMCQQGCKASYILVGHGEEQDHAELLS